MSTQMNSLNETALLSTHAYDMFKLTNKKIFNIFMLFKTFLLILTFEFDFCFLIFLKANCLVSLNRPTPCIATLPNTEEGFSVN